MNQAQIKSALLTALRNRIPNLDTSSDSDATIKAGALAHVMEGLYQKLEWTQDQVFADSATTENLDRHAATYALTRKPPTAAEGTVALTGTPALVVSAGLTLTRADGTAYTTTSGTTLDGSGEGSVTAEANAPGAAGNCEDGEALTLTSPPSGLDADATAEGDFTGGKDEETDPELLARLLNRVRHPPAGGTKNDWEQWALEVEGVIEAHVYPLRRGLGTVDVCVFTEGPGGVRALPGSGLLDDVADYLETVHPVTVKSYEVLAATEVPVDVTVSAILVAEGYEDADVETAVETAIEAAFPTLAPGDTLYLTTHLHATIAAVAGVLDYILTAPVSNVTSTVNATTCEVLVPGTLTATAA